MSLLLDTLFATIALGHLAVDVLNGQRAVLLTYLSVPLGLSNTALSLVSTVYVISGAMIQPVFGHLADRIGPRWLGGGGGGLPWACDWRPVARPLWCGGTARPDNAHPGSGGERSPEDYRRNTQRGAGWLKNV